MKLLRLELGGRIVPCVLDDRGHARDVSSLVSDFGPETAMSLAPTLAAANLSALPEVDRTAAKVLAPLSAPRNIWCIGLNYSDHAAESGMPIPDEPILFSKASSTYCSPDDPILWSDRMTKLDWEVELGVVIGKGGLDIAREDALDHVLGYVLVNDVSERAWQIERGGQWVKGKSFPNFCPTGPILTTTDELGPADNLAMWLDVNGERMQTGSTSKMIFNVPTIVSYMSEFCALQPGDLICTGTPPGVGLGMKPPRYLSPGDIVTLGIQGLGEQRQIVTPLNAKG